MYSKSLSGFTNAQDSDNGTPKANLSVKPSIEAQKNTLINSSAKYSSLKSEVLLSGKKELQIEHAGEIYKLRLTSLGKLILTK